MKKCITIIALLIIVGECFSQTDTILNYKGKKLYYTNYPLPNTATRYFNGFGGFVSFYDTARLAFSVTTTGSGAATYNNATGVFNIPTAGTNWSLTGNSGLDSLTNFLGSTDYNPVLFRMNNVRAGQITDSIIGNTSFGYQALGNSIRYGTGTLINTDRNTAVGLWALSINREGYQNTAVGASAMKFNTSGLRNVAVGVQALQANTTGQYNVALGGYQTLFLNTTGNLNIAIGKNVLGANIGGSSNIAAGENALGVNTSGVNNVAIGPIGTLAANTSGGYNLAIGQQVLGSNTTASENIGMGYQAAFSNTTGTLNLALGGEALWGNTTGSYNIGIGNKAGRFRKGGVVATHYFGSIFIGDSTRPLNATNDIHEIVIGNNVTGLGSYTTVLGDSTTLTTGIYGSLSLGVIGTPNASSLVDMSSTTKGMLVPRMNTTQQNAIGTPATGLLIFNTDTASHMQYTGSAWQNVRGGSGAGGVAWGAITGTLSDQTDLNTALGLKAPLASPTFTGTVTIPTPFTLGATSVTSTGTQLNYLNAATGTTGTASTNLVFSTTPTFTTNITTPIVIGGTGSGGFLYLQSTSNATKGKLILGTTSAYDELNTRLGMGTTSPAYTYTDANYGAALPNAQFGNYFIQSVSLNNGFVTNNATFNGSVLQYKSTGFASTFQLANGKVILYGAASGTAGNTVTFNSGLTVDVTGRVAIAAAGAGTPTAALMLPAGTATASTSPLKFTSGTLLTTAEAGAVEFLTDGYYVTTTTGAKRRFLAASTAGRSTAQTAAVASVATYTLGASDASYEVSANILVTTSSAEAFTVTCAYTDEGNTARTLTLPFVVLAGTTVAAINFANGAVPYEGVPIHIRVKASTAITIATTGTFTGATYNVEGIIKQTQ